jgi:small nuclear ribonucleoprotein E
MSGHQRNRKPVETFANLATNRQEVRIFLYERPNVVMDATLLGFDEFMNVVLENAVEINTKTDTKTLLGNFMLKSDCIALVAQKPA